MLSLALLVRCGSQGVKSPVRGWICGVEVITVAVRMEPRNIGLTCNFQILSADLDRR